MQAVGCPVAAQAYAVVPGSGRLCAAVCGEYVYKFSRARVLVVGVLRARWLAGDAWLADFQRPHGVLDAALGLTLLAGDALDRTATSWTAGRRRCGSSPAVSGRTPVPS